MESALGLCFFVGVSDFPKVILILGNLLVEQSDISSYHVWLVYQRCVACLPSCDTKLHEELVSSYHTFALCGAKSLNV